MSKQTEIQNVVVFFQTAFTFIFALAITESFKQFVADRAENEADRHIHKKRTWSLIAFLLLVIPFFEGISRYYYSEYIVGPIPQPYPLWLLFDAIAFVVEAALFFVMSRTLAPVLWKRFYYSVLLLCAVDTIWAFVSWVAHAVPIVPWLILNFCAVIVFSGMVQINFTSGLRACAIGCGLVFVRTVLDYYLTWSFYFPS